MWYVNCLVVIVILFSSNSIAQFVSIETNTDSYTYSYEPIISDPMVDPYMDGPIETYTDSAIDPPTQAEIEEVEAFAEAMGPMVSPVESPVANIPAPPLPAPVFVDLGAGISDQGHCGDADPYDVYSWNCHSNTNLAILTAGDETRGACICNDPAINTIGTHSFAYSVFERDGRDWTCIWNYGQACCYNDDTVPPDLSQGDGNRCAQWACNFGPGPEDDQYTPGRTRCLDEGELVEIPGPAACVRQAYGNAPNDPSISMDQIIAGESDPGRYRASCLDCCYTRANAWPSTIPGDREQFLEGCTTLCRGTFGNGEDLGERYGQSCANDASVFSFSSYGEQCRGCCLDGAVNGSYPRQEVSSCLAVCEQRY